MWASFISPHSRRCRSSRRRNQLALVAHVANRTGLRCRRHGPIIMPALAARDKQRVSRDCLLPLWLIVLAAPSVSLDLCVGSPGAAGTAHADAVFWRVCV
jgi:hypothetical protein